MVKPEADEETIKINSIEIDSKEDIIHACENYKSAVIENAGVYPKGSKLGNAIHSIFEKIDFIKFGNIASENLALKNTFINDITEEAFEIQSLDVKGNPEWISITARMIWNTLNAELPVIRGNSVKKASFCLKDLSDECRKSEVEFHLGINREDWMNRFCKGYIDLLFVRKDEAGNDYFSILDWKSDLLEDSDYYDKEKLSAKVEKEYAVQRVLYSFCLIKWLKMFYPESTDEEIFQKHFGGIYYAFVRGCKAGCCNGIYAQTWKSFKALQNSYNNVIKLIEA